ncbi:MAG: DUF3369 domain-containing protein [Pseudomonadota bacterium]
MPDEKKPLRLKAAATVVPTGKKPQRKDWRILVVDDDEEVHSVTRLILGQVRYKGRGIELLSAFSAIEARQMLAREQDIAVILLDVVMERDDAGLQLVRVIREEFHNEAVRIILRTGQPGQVPEDRIIVDYDINDYKAKSELTAQKLFTTVIAALRSYDTIVSLDKTRKGLEKILDSISTLFQVHSIQQFASGVLTQLSAFLGCRPNGVICAQLDLQAPYHEPGSCDDMRILAATGEYHECLSCTMSLNCKHHDLVQLVRKALSERKNQITDDYTVLYLQTDSAQATVALLHGGLGQADESDQRLLEVFASKISIAFANALRYQKMMNAQTAG